MGSMPKLPGYSFPDPTKTNHAKKQQFGYKNGYALSSTTTSGGTTPTILLDATGEPLQQQEESDIDLAQLTFTTTSAVNNAAVKKPDVYLHPHIQNYKKVLGFSAYNIEEVNNVVRYRYTNINYFLEDDTIQVLEPKMLNSGIPQGVLMRRQKIMRGDGTAYHWTDLQVGADVIFFAREYHIRDADAFTRAFYLDEKGVLLNDPEPEPVTQPSIAVGTSVTLGGTPSSPSPQQTRYSPAKTTAAGQQGVGRHQLRKFLDYDRKVLRFYCVWDDTDTLFGERRPFIIHYFLVDDSVEVREIVAPNSGRDAASIFMKKQRLPKKTTKGTGAFQSNVGPQTSTVTEYYTDADFQIGQTISIFGRPFLLYDLDGFTREHYREKYGIVDFPVVPVKDDAPRFSEKEIPEYTGFGSEEDSLANCLSLVPKPPKKVKPKHPYNSTDILRFSATIQGGKKDDGERKFVVSYHLEDDTISVYENAIRGVKGGKFTERKKIKNPERTGASVPLDEQYYNSSDLYIGGVVSIHNHLFKLTEGDSYTTRFIMENNMNE